ncbi:MAG: alpha/beta fold hydrolase [Flavobacteriales bacterium]
MNKTNQHIILNDHRKLGYAEYGNENGKPIIYCHGSQSSRLEMHYDTSFAIKNNLRIITIDRPGHGISDFNPEGSILSFANDANQLVEHLKIEKFSMVGMSAGSPFALGIAYAFPEKIEAVNIISGFAPFDSSSKQFLSKEIKTMLNLAKYFPFLLNIMLKIQAKQLKKNPKKALIGFLKIMDESDQIVLKDERVMQVIQSMFVEAFRNGSQGVAYEISKILVRKWGFKLNEINVPVTFWQGKQDNNVPYQWAELMSNEIDNSELNLFPDEGHLIIFNHAEEIFK